MVSTTVNPEVQAAIDLATTTRIALIVEYDGRRYHGFQRQAELPTIQEELEKAVLEFTGESTRLATASRTDSGVHARGQVVSFETGSVHSPETFIKGLNYYLPKDIAVKAAYRVEDSFDVRRQAVSREYNYYILNSGIRSPLRERFYHRVAGHLDIEAMNQACRMLIGEHDFASFVSNDEVASKTTVRRVYRAEMRRQGEVIVFNTVANSFLMHQVRNTLGPLIRVGRGKMSSDQFLGILEAKQPGLAWPAVPARGLCLMQVNYENSFEDGRC
ncbi:MAG: tRNA pseudouridine(38-40) synthase TruA [Dehalococcoidales bacterium]|jgi:tRNA pseudouridine38-40 synthase|nr:tRNA pseudouridine(38-40) synthase TruA [Dehalococcoidales bacterium]MDP6631885.1 tRNA pseudouridine(38-40) synthase TruA [Dehalococcoidales bacterium]